ncbi:cytochrome P450 [Annulohypoxylon maeteangense]|uniref:cytochrome P450 n=1 Tax=Annulohypoxylon maeteangense TaxID=1927788 RepID=UPI00200749C4|nr:cytochrome P450 [Annulohypoxylon maeteangense]KAI0889808.1 cytochrome P450 [Annulohypoxylon maeteangense]
MSEATTIKALAWLTPKLGSNISVILSSLIFTYLAWVYLSSTVLHPLGRFPGPRISAITKLPYWIAAYNGTQVQWLQRLHARYGPVVRFAPNDISYTDARAWKDIYGYQKGRKENSRDRKFYPEPENGSPSLPDISDTEKHGIVRRAFAPAFSDRAIKGQEGLLQNYANLMVTVLQNALQEKGGAGADIAKIYNLATFDIMADLTYGESLGCLKTSEYTTWIELVFTSISFIPLIQFLQSYPILGALFKMLEPESVKKTRIAHHQYSADRLDRRLARGADRADVWSGVLSGDGNHLLSLQELRTNSEVFMTAGTETSATLLSGLTYLLLRNPRSMDLLTKEIRGAFNSNEQMSIEALARLPYLNACIEEGLRMYPPVPQGFPRTIAKGGNVVLGEWLPEGTSVSVSTTAAYRDPNYFKDPNEFVPERWMGDPKYENDKRDARQPFSFGPRNCLGMGLAWHEMRLLLSKVIFNFDLELCDKSEDWFDQKIYVLWAKKPLMCRGVRVSTGA